MGVVYGRYINEYIYEELEIRTIEKLEELIKINCTIVGNKKKSMYYQKSESYIMVADNTQ